MSWHEYKQYQQFKRLCSSSWGGDAKAWNSYQRGNGGGWRDGTQDHTTPRPPKGPCRCCGKEGHAKWQCEHKNKTCGVCNKTGHMADVCRHGDQKGSGGNAKDSNTPDTQQGKDQSAKVAWLCFHCGTTNPTLKEKKCNSCKAFRKKQDAEDEADGKPAYPASTAKLLDETEPDKVKETIEQKEKEKQMLEEDVVCKTAWVKENPLYQTTIDMAKKRISELEGDINKLKMPPSTKVTKVLLGDLQQQTNNSDNKMKQIDEEIRSAKEKKAKVELRVKADLEEAEQKFKERKDFLEEGLVEAHKQWDKQMEELTKKRKTAEDEHKLAKEKLTDKMAERTMPEVKTSIQAATFAEAGSLAGSVAEETLLDVQAVAAHFYQDVTLREVPPEHKDVLVESVGKLLHSQMKTFMEAMDQKYKRAAQTMQEEEDASEPELLDVTGDGTAAAFRVQTASAKSERQRQKKDQKKAGAAAAAATTMEVDQEERKKAEKRAQEHQGGREPDQAEIQDEEQKNSRWPLLAGAAAASKAAGAAPAAA